MILFEFPTYQCVYCLEDYIHTYVRNDGKTINPATDAVIYKHFISETCKDKDVKFAVPAHQFLVSGLHINEKT